MAEVTGALALAHETLKKKRESGEGVDGKVLFKASEIKEIMGQIQRLNIKIAVGDETSSSWRQYVKAAVAAALAEDAKKPDYVPQPRKEKTLEDLKAEMEALQKRIAEKAAAAGQ